MIKVLSRDLSVPQPLFGLASPVCCRILGAGWRADMILSGELESRFDVDLHTCLYIVRGRKP